MVQTNQSNTEKFSQSSLGTFKIVASHHLSLDYHGRNIEQGAEIFRQTGMNEFQTHMKFHKMKANTEALEVIVKAPLELLELQFSKVLEPFFTLKKRQINLMEAELNVPGREMAYIIKTRDRFQSHK